MPLGNPRGGGSPQGHQITSVQLYDVICLYLVAHPVAHVLRTRRYSPTFLLSSTFLGPVGVLGIQLTESVLARLTRLPHVSIPWDVEWGSSHSR